MPKAHRVTITINQLKDGRWRGTVRADGEFYASTEGPEYFAVTRQAAHYATGLTSEMETPAWRRARGLSDRTAPARDEGETR